VEPAVTTAADRGLSLADMKKRLLIGLFFAGLLVLAAAGALAGVVRR
jgi:hypothetical protein